MPDSEAPAGASPAAPADASDESPEALPSAAAAPTPAEAAPLPRTALDLFQEYGTPVYPGHPVAVACYALLSAPTLAAALVPVGQSGSTLAAAKAVTAAQDAVQATATMIGRLSRGESIDAALKWSNDWWARCIRSHQPAFDRRLESGLEQARRMEPLFRELVAEARARAAEAATTASHAAEGTAEAPGEAANTDGAPAPPTVGS
ncbi:MAG TPA: hypothetical protein VFS40_11385 [Gemmatimonadales bacterium]|nr:hypothetical protein [Gemmatimonadales bacterium]